MKKRSKNQAPNQTIPTPPLPIHFLVRHPVISALLCAMLLCGILIGIPFASMLFDDGKISNASELVQISGHVRTVKRTKTKERYSRPIIYLSIYEDLRTFAIKGAGYDAIKSLTPLTPGAKVEFSISKDESIASDNIPIVYELRTENKILLTVSDYNNNVDTASRESLYLGIFGFACVVLAFIIRLRYKNK